MRFHGLALHCRRQVFRASGIRAALRRIASFCSRNFADRRTDREKGVLARAWNCSSALTELKGRARARFEGAALVAAFVAKLVLK